MTLYIILALIFLIFSFGELSAKKDRQFKLLCVSYVLLLFFSSFRGVSVGTDFLNYSIAFKEFSKGMSLEQNELAWQFIFKFFGNFFNFRVYVFFFYGILYFFILRFIWEKVEYPLLGVLLYYLSGYYFDSFNIMRQCFALIFILNAVRNIENKNFIQFLIFIILGSFFHYSVLFFIPFYLLIFVNKINDRTFKLISIVLIIISLVLGYNDYISQFLTDTIFSGNLDKYTKYMNLKKENLSFLGFLFNCFIPSMIAVSVILFTKNKKIFIYLALYIIGIIINNLIINYQWIFRFSSEFLLFFLLLVWTNAIKEASNKFKRILLMAFMFIYLIIYFYFALKNNYNGIIPYAFVYE